MSNRTTPSPLMVRLDEESKTLLAQAAALRKVSVSDYVRMIMLTQAQREVTAGRDQTIALSPEEQLSFWNSLQSPVKLSPTQKKLGKTMRGES